MNITAQDAAKHLLKLKAAEDNLLGWVRLQMPNWKLPQFHLDMIDALDKLEKNTLTSHHNLSAADCAKTEEVPVLYGSQTQPIYYVYVLQ